MDVGVDCNGYFPVSLDEVIKRVENKGITKHHDKEVKFSEKDFFQTLQSEVK